MRKSDARSQRIPSRHTPIRWMGSVLLAALVLLATPFAYTQTPQDRLVVPGSRIGPWKLDTPFPELTQMNGPTGIQPTIASQYVSKATWYPWGHLGIAAASHDKRKVEFLAVLDTVDFSTRSGIRIKSTRRRVQAVYGEPEIESDISTGGKIITALIYDKIGLAVFLDRDVAQMLLVFRPGDGGALSSLCGG